MSPPEPVTATLKEWVEVFMRHSMRNFISYSKESGLSMSQIGALFHIQSRRASGVTDIGQNMGVTSAAASQMLERLVQQGLISRSEDTRDRRVRTIILTEAGRRALHESLQVRQKWLEELAATLSLAEQEQVSAALKLLIEKANQLEGIPDA